MISIIFLIIFNAIPDLMGVSIDKRNEPGFLTFQQDKVKFYLWNKGTVEQQISLNDYGNVTKGPYKVLIHGWIDGGTGATFFFYGPFVQKYIKLGANVICVDWSFYSHRPLYDTMLWLRPVADTVARLIVGLKNKAGISLNDVHVIGHSYGGQISGFVGKYIQQMTNGGKLARISGLDPAGIGGFRDRPATDRLNKSDAVYVDTLVSDIIQFGTGKPFGQVNFYIYCGGYPQGAIFMMNHNLAPFYYEYGILKDDLVGKQCECTLQQMHSCKPSPTNILGENTDFKKPGTYYLNIDIKAMMEDAKEAMKTAPKTRYTIDFFNMAKNILNLLYGVNNKPLK